MIKFKWRGVRRTEDFPHGQDVASEQPCDPETSSGRRAKILLVSLIIFSTFLTNGCGKNRTILLFNHHPITENNITDNAREFQAGERIYYIFITGKQLKSNVIQVKVMKMDEKAGYSPTKLAFADRYKMSKDQIFYYTDYVVFHDAGYYSMFIFSDELPRPLAIEPFRVKK